MLHKTILHMLGGRKGTREGGRKSEKEGRREGGKRREKIQRHQTPVFFTSIFPWFCNYQRKAISRCWCFSICHIPPFPGINCLSKLLWAQAGQAGLPSFVLPGPPPSSPALHKLRIQELFCSKIWFLSLALLPRLHAPNPSVHFYFSLLFINMSMLLLEVKGFLRN